MSEFVKQPVVLSLERDDALPLSIRAKALVFSDPLSIYLLEYIERIAPSEAPVLIGGETGTGKELIARHIHALSKRSGPFLAVNCGAISEHLVDSELFGHEAGAFTGAVSSREGWFEAANHGTLFLDEICDLPLPLQVKLLRVLQEKEVVRIGATKTIPVDVRLVVASNVDLDSAVAAGNLRQDLLYRINIVHVKLPPLRDRPGDVLPLAEHFLKLYSQRANYKKPEFSPEAIHLLLSYSWPGNIRELENVIHFALLVAGSGVIDAKHLKITGGVNTGAGNYSSSLARNPIKNNTFPIQSADAQDNNIQDDPLSLIALQLRRLFSEYGAGPHFDKLESLIVHQAFSYVGSNQVHGALLLGISRNVMRTLLKRHGLLSESGVTKESSNNHNYLDDEGAELQTG